MAQKTNKFVKGRIYRLPVKEKRTENSRAYYVVVADGKEYAIKLFDFQKEEDVPETLSCTVKDVHEDGTPVLIQDFSPLLRRFYQVGETYPFRVRADCTQGELLPYYEVADSHNFHFRLIYFGNAVLHVGQRICCRVRRLQGHRLSLELAEEQQEESEAGFWLPEDLLRSIGASGHLRPDALHTCMGRTAFIYCPLP